jgi:hypothetical protein
VLGLAAQVRGGIVNIDEVEAAVRQWADGVDPTVSGGEPVAVDRRAFCNDFPVRDRRTGQTDGQTRGWSDEFAREQTDRSDRDRQAGRQADRQPVRRRERHNPASHTH